MKKLLLTSVTVLFCALTAGLLTGCSGGDEEGIEATAKKIPVSSEMDCLFAINAESIDNFDYYIKYIDKDGATKTEKLKWGEVKLDQNKVQAREAKFFLTSGIPAKLAFRFYAQPKEGLDLTQRYVISCAWDVNASTKTAKGALKSWANEKGSQGLIIEPDKIQQWIEEGCPLSSYLFDVDKNGNVTKVGPWE